MLKCSKEAFARCPTSHLCGATFMEGSECDKFNQEVPRQPQTNADRIRAMSDEELAKEIVQLMAAGIEIMLGISPPHEAIAEAERRCMLWFRQPVKEDA